MTDQDHGGILAVAGVLGASHHGFKHGVEVAPGERRLRHGLDPAPGLGRDLRGLYRPAQGAGQQHVGPIHDAGEPVGGLPEPPPAPPRERPLVVGQIGGVPGHGDRVADDQELHGVGAA